MAEEILIVAEEARKTELDALHLDFDKLAEVVRYADSERALCTGNDPKGFKLVTVNAKAARGLREQFCGEDWVYDETDNQPGIMNPALSLRVIPCNFDENAGNLLKTPTNRTSKGAASGTKVRCNGTGWLPGLVAPAFQDDREVTTLVLGIYSEDGEPLRAELSFPIGFEKSQYTSFSKRIVLLTGAEDWSERTGESNRGEPTETVDIPITRKTT
ncbi:hypothetical protein [Aurantimonas sp. A3-2-R12]|uniref:hypothetical protein n=1 Tax=Aurantimonas sp. A3-2-R12 TaxID=3114362 RepID=UPI002E1829ED|nr:hypothetical protein [Aurantimonas sp. A3-2-R12]